MCSPARRRVVTRGEQLWFRASVLWGYRGLPTNVEGGYGKEWTVMGGCSPCTLATMHACIVVLHRLVECLLVGVSQEVEACDSACLR